MWGRTSVRSPLPPLYNSQKLPNISHVEMACKFRVVQRWEGAKFPHPFVLWTGCAKMTSETIISAWQVFKASVLPTCTHTQLLRHSKRETRETWKQLVVNMKNNTSQTLSHSATLSTRNVDNLSSVKRKLVHSCNQRKTGVWQILSKTFFCVLSPFP